jgi:hypothetical protein
MNHTQKIAEGREHGETAIKIIFFLVRWCPEGEEDLFEDLNLMVS